MRAIALLALVLLAASPEQNRSVGENDAGVMLYTTYVLPSYSVSGFSIGHLPDGPHAILFCDGGCEVHEIDGGIVYEHTRFCEVAARALTNGMGCR